MIKVALIGIGGMGMGHFNTYKKLEEAKIVAVADPRTEMAREKVNDENIKIYADMEELIKNEDVDMVDICTPSYLHVPLSIRAMELGKHVICEKPMSQSSKDTKSVIKASEKYGKKYMVAHVLRFLAPYVYLKNVIESRELGNIVHLDMKRILGIPRWTWENWMRDVKKSGGCTIDTAIHDIDFSQYAFGLPKKIQSVHHCMRENNDYIVANLIYDNHTVTITSGWFNYELPFRMEYQAIFENGFVERKADGTVLKNGEIVDLGNVDEGEDTGINIKSGDGFLDEIRCFISSINGNESADFVLPESSETSIRLAETIMKKAIKH